MYCANCGTQLVAGLSYCNRCGANLKERTETNTASSTGSITAFLTAITLLGVLGLGMMLGGAIALRKAGLTQDIVGVFMMFTFLIVSVTEFMLVRNLSRFSAPKDAKKRSLSPPAHQDLRLPQTSSMGGEPVPSVTENTTRTLEYARREQ